MSVWLAGHESVSRWLPALPTQSRWDCRARFERTQGSLRSNNCSSSTPDEVDRVILRAGNNRAWSRTFSREKTTFALDEFARLTQQAMGGDGMCGAITHLFINGIYWGLYNPVVRADTFYTSQTHGGEESDWFAVNHGGDLSGNVNRYDYLRSNLKNRNMAIAENYEELTEYLDIDNFIDYLLIHWYPNTGDWPQNNIVPGNLSILVSEIHYHPTTSLENHTGDNDFEYLELHNPGVEGIDLSGYSFTSGITFTFPEDTMLLPGETGVVVGDRSCFEALHGTELNVLVDWLHRHGAAPAVEGRDLDNDGISDIFEYAFGTHPLRVDQSPIEFGSAEISYTLRLDRTEVTVTPELSTSLGEISQPCPTF